MPLDHAESKAAIAFDRQMFDEDFHICADVEILFGSNQKKGLASFLYGLLPVVLAWSLVFGLLLCNHVSVAGMVRVAACLCAASWHQQRPWMESTEGPGEKEEENKRWWWWKMTSPVKKAPRRSLPPLRSLPFLLH